MVFVDVIIAERVDEFTDFEIADVGDEVSKQSVRANVERHAQKRIRRALIKLAVKKRGSSPTVREGVHVLDLELKQRMTRRQVDMVTLARVPAADYQAA